MQWQLLSILFFIARSAELTTALEDEKCDPVFFFKCENSEKCMSHIFVCDGVDDCGDNSDENMELCRNEIPSYGDLCKPYEYRCIDRSHCISEEKYCDGIKDCDDGSDESENCNQNITCKGFKCKSGHCILDTWVCDGIEDCNDGNDELNCSNYQVIPSSQCNNTINKYLCDNKRCINLDLVCNSIDNCGDGSDEQPHECAQAQETCNLWSKPCVQKCKATPKGYQCSCENGYFLLDEQNSCEDINECEQYGLCDQTCINTLGSYYCQCEIGYNLEKDGHSCKPADGEALMLFASKTSIEGYYLDSKIHFSAVEDLNNTVGLTFNSKYIFWTDIRIGKETIFRSLKDDIKPEAVVTLGLGCPDDIAIDWITGNFYFTDSVYKRIGACDGDGIYCTVVVSDNIQKPRGISLSPSKGKMYWSDWGKNPQISVANMDGSNYKIFIKENILWPNGLTIDHISERLYWIDTKLKTIESIQFDGQDRRIIFHNKANHPYSIAVFGNRIYWSDWNMNSIQSCNKFNGENIETLLKANKTLYGVHIYHSTMNIKIENPCASNPCSDLCLLTENKKYSCACTLDKELDSDRHTCKHKEGQNYLTIAVGNMIINYYRELLGRPIVTFNVTEDHISVLTHDPFTVTLIAGGKNKKELYRYNAYTGDFNDIRPIATDVDGCIAFDYLSGNLYKSSVLNKLIQVQSLDGDTQIEFSYDERPRDLIIIPKEGTMFVVFESESNDTSFSITRLPMDGVNGKARVVEKNLKGPKISLAYDEKDNRVFWSDEGSYSIWSVNSQGEDKKLIRSDVISPVSIAIFDSDIFWVSRGSTLLSWTDKRGLSSKIKSLNLPTQQQNEIPILQVIEGNKSNYTHPCSLNNGNCSHICLVTDLNKSLCMCPPDLIIDADGKSCRVKGLCANNEVKCSKTDKCIKNNQRCDGIKDCENGEDEMKCQNIPFPNKFIDFTYRNGKLLIRTGNATVYELDDEH